ncbi:endothelin-converting enzyme [Anseongella ginsenosidimutans]|uniref:Endothelin-converting enzyme n=1 Tax=Anseongella ginsenosidimutans TaxID=496056 RepID=A0A4R3KUB3_9SPHI|nr:M13 family metallopeptidase [Anseongella ginsenosidimutans]QEC51644.1 M13 family metallopeptidase [Anseongella ginsenosidimutans]TCS88979.1 endothelin-converting enzyme [Anseongella ginsenosidimutans]
MNKFIHLPAAAFGLFLLHACSQGGEKAETAYPEAFDVSNMDTTLGPCQDFDNFANGTWKENNPIPPSESRWGSFNILLEENEAKLQEIVNGLLEKEDHSKGSNEQLIADFYRSYTDTQQVAALGIDPLQPYLEQINAIETLDDYVKLVGTMRPVGFTSFLSMYVDADDRNSSMNTLYVTQSGLSLREKDYYENNSPRIADIRKEFVEHVTRMFQLMDYMPDHARENAEKILDFETRIAGIQMSRVEMRDPVKTYNKRSYQELKALLPAFNWDVYTGESGLKADTLVVRQLDYLKGLNQVLENTPVEELKLHATYHLLTDMAPFLPREFQEESFHFYSTVLSGVKERKDLEKRALRTTNSMLGFPLGELFVARHFPESSREKMVEMIENLRETYRDRILDLKWMSDETKKKALTKLEAFTYKIGYPDKWKDYSNIDIHPDSLFANVMHVSQYEYGEMLDKLGKPVDKSEWYMTPQTVNAYYNPTNNEIVFPAGILQPPFFNPEADDAINYGGIMTVIGHEFSHGFDDQGSQFDWEGNLNNWWTEEDRANFDALTGKLAAQYSGIEVLDSVYIDGKLTLGENIADLAGLTMAYHALERSLQGKPEPELIDGFNWKQRFFLGWAQVWRGNITDERLLQQVKTDPHSPARYRINATVSNLDEFYDAWGCSEGANSLPPEERVYIW